MVASFTAFSATALACVIVALSIRALVVSMIRLIETEPAKSLPSAVVSAAIAAVSVSSGRAAIAVDVQGRRAAR